MKLTITLLTLLFLISCGGEADKSDSEDKQDAQTNPDSPMVIAMNSPSCTLELGKYGLPVVNVCAAGYYYEGDERKYATKADCLEGSVLVGNNDLGLEVINAKFAPRGCNNYASTIVRCYINDDRGNIYTLTSSNYPIGDNLLDMVKEKCLDEGGEYKVIKINGN
jgi:hypothetical protein